MRRLSWTEQQVVKLCMEADNQKEKFESLQLEKDVLADDKEALEQQLKLANVELAVVKASVDQAEKEKAKMEATFSKQYSKATEEI